MLQTGCNSTRFKAYNLATREPTLIVGTLEGFVTGNTVCQIVHHLPLDWNRTGQKGHKTSICRIQKNSCCDVVSTSVSAEAVL
jgi:hypothetical protein